MNKTEFLTLINQNFKHVPADFFKQIEAYKSFLFSKNELMNLTKFATEDLVYGEYFYESIIPYKNIDFTKIKNVLDIGSGSGIPGIVLKLLFPHINLTIIDSINKKCEFMKDLVKYLNLTNVIIINKRAENIQKSEVEKFDFVTSRAVANLPILLEISTSYAKINGLIVEPKSTKFNEELLLAKSIINQLNLHEENSYDFLSENDHFHHVFIFRKIKSTPKKFPRNWKQIIKDYE